MIKGASVAELLRLLTSNHLPLTDVGSNPDRDFRFFYVRKLYLTERWWQSPRSNLPLILWLYSVKGGYHCEEFASVILLIARSCLK
jgi:hypothetical protein